MTSVVLRYSAPLMAFGHTARFDQRATAATPTLSALQGMVAAAAGHGRAEPWPDWIGQLRVAIRVDRAGRILNDYHTINQPSRRRYRHLEPKSRERTRVLATADGGRASFDTFQTRRSYVADAGFLVAVHDPDGLVEAALRAPRWSIYAGRKSCPITEPFVLGRSELLPERAIAVVPTVGGGDDEVELDAIFFDPPTDGSSAAREIRNDRASGFGSYRPQPRWSVTVTVAQVPDWFIVMDQLEQGKS